MRGGAQAEYRAAAIEVADKMFHPCVIGPQETHEEKHHVRLVQRLNTGHVRGTGFDVTLFI